MKPAAFELARPASLREAAALLLMPGNRVLAGGQSLGPMLNLRLAQPAALVPVAHLPELHRAESGPEAVTLGAAITHAAIADGRTPDINGSILARVAEGIAYRAVRNRGTIGGSLCHADPAADWLCTLSALGASVLTWRPAGGRAISLARFVTGAFRNALEEGEIVQAVRVPRPSPGARWAYYKMCRKPGEFAHAMAAVLDDPERGIRRAAIGAVGGPPVLLEGAAVMPDAVDAALAGSGLDAIARHMQAVALRRALERAAA